MSPVGKYSSLIMIFFRAVVYDPELERNFGSIGYVQESFAPLVVARPRPFRSYRQVHIACAVETGHYGRCQLCPFAGRDRNASKPVEKVFSGKKNQDSFMRKLASLPNDLYAARPRMKSQFEV